jgi:outer membrane protein TolC
MGGRLDGQREAALARASATSANQRLQRQQLALRVVGAYFRAQLAEQALELAQETVSRAEQTWQFAQARAKQDLMLQSEVARADAFRAQAHAELVSATQRLADARDELVLLVGDRARSATRLSTPIEGASEPEGAGSRPDLEQARSEESAARADVIVASASQKPQLGLQLRGGTLWGGNSALGAFATLGVAGRWDFFAPSAHAQALAAEQAASAATEARRWAEARAQMETEVSRRAVVAAHARLAAQREAVAAAQTARTLREARHRQGLLPLTDLLDAEAAVTSARTALLDAQFAERFGRAQLAFALAQPIEGVTP